MKIRLGLVGLGGAWETRYRSALLSLADRFEVRAVCAEVSHRAAQAAREFAADAVDGFRVLTARPDIDAVLVLGTSWYGTAPILAACDAGKAVYCAAALDADMAKAGELRRRVQESGVAFMVEFPRRFAPATVRLKELIATRLGSPRLLFCHMRSPRMARDRSSRNGLATGDVTHELIELVDWCRYVVGGEPSSVLGVRHLTGAAREDCDYQMMSLDFASAATPGEGALAQISSGRYIPAGWPEAISFRPPAALQVACEQGIAFVDLPSSLTWYDEAGRHREPLENERPLGEQLLMQFHRAVTSLVRKTSDLEDAYGALQIVVASLQSIQDSRRIPL